MKAYSYIRFSTKQQILGDSLQRQQEAIEAYCKSNNLELSEDTYQDLGISAFRGSNGDAALGQFIQACEDGKIPRGSYLVVESLDRLSREEVQFALEQFLAILRHDIIVVTLLDDKTFQTPVNMTDLIVSITVMERANNESKVKSERIKYMWEKRRKLHKPHGLPPFWIDYKDGQYQLNDRAQLVKRIYELGLSIGSHAIATILNKEGVDIGNQNIFRQPFISRILSDRKTIGEYLPHKLIDGKRVPQQPIPNYYPPVIEESLYYSVQSAMDSRKPNHKKGSTTTHRNVFKGWKCSCGKLVRPHFPRHLIVI